MCLPTVGLTQAGVLDPSFGNQGIVTADVLGTGNVTYTGWAAARNPVSGDFVVAAGVAGSEGHDQWTVLRFHANGTPDLSFGTGGVVRTDFQAFDADSDHPADIAFDTSGAAAQHRILVAGSATILDLSSPNPWAPRLAVVAYLPDGSLDASFATGGVYLMSGNFSAEAVAIEARPDGSVVVVGRRDGDGIVLRLLHDGTPDATFGIGGIATVPTNGAGLATGAVTPDGGAVLAVQSYSFVPVFHYEIALTRLTSTGSVDANFGTAGTVVLEGDLLSGLAARPDGSLVVLGLPGNFVDPQYLLVLTAAGTPAGAPTPLAGSFGPTSLDVGAAGQVLLGGQMAPNYSTFAVAKFTPAGAADAVFDADGYATADFGGYQTSAHALAMPDGSVAVVGLRNDPVTFATSFVVGRLQGNGAADATFADGAGFGAIASQASSQDFGQDIAVHQADGKLVVLVRSIGSAGTTVLRYLPDGTLDPSFGGNGVRTLGVAGGTALGIALQSTGRIIVVGLNLEFLSGPPWIQYSLVAMGLTSAGDLDPTFDGDGVAAVMLPAQYASGGGVALQADDRILVCTTAYVTFPNSQMTVARFQPDGAVDTSFGAGGIASVGVSGKTVQATSIATANDGRIAVAGYVESPWPAQAVHVALAWLNGSGTLLAGPVTTVPGFGVDVAVDGTGRAVVAAQRYWGTTIYDPEFNVIGVEGASPWSTTQFAALRVLPTGGLDPGFGNAGVTALTVSTADSAFATCVAVQPDTRILIAGSATVQPTPTTWANAAVVARLTTTGATDPSFGSGGFTHVNVGEFNFPQAVVLQGDGKVVVVGTASARGSGFSEKDDVVVFRLLGVTSPHVLVEALEELVRTMAEHQVLNQGRAKALAAKLQAALNQIDHGNLATAANQLTAFRNQVLAFATAGILSAANATVLYSAADGIVALLTP